jgi:S1-C subfamily serine protease
MRYATSQPNRVILSELLETSPAAVAGLEPGDEVVSYDGQRIFTASALKLLTLAGVPGALTEMRVLRAGEEHRFFVPRGPLGTRLEIASRAPYSR